MLYMIVHCTCVHVTHMFRFPIQFRSILKQTYIPSVFFPSHYSWCSGCPPGGGPPTFTGWGSGGSGGGGEEKEEDDGDCSVTP